MEWHAYIGLGANLPFAGNTPQHTLQRAVAALGRLGVLTAQSGWWRTEPVGPVLDQPAFLNGAVALSTDLAPEALLAGLLAIEQQHGRVRTALAKGPRTLDLDLLLVQQADGTPVLCDTATLTLPHPELARRRFVLAPLAEIAPTLRHPVLGSTLQALLQRLQDPSEVERLGSAAAGSEAATDGRHHA